MPPSMYDGIGGLEAVHWWDGIPLNRLDVLPRARLTRITGLHDAADADDNREPNLGFAGEQPYPSEERGRTIVYEGIIEARSLSDLRKFGTGLRAKCRSRFAEKQMTVSYDPAYNFYGSMYYMAKALAFTADDEQVNSPQSTYVYSRTFSLTVRQSDPRYYAITQSATAITAIPATINVNHVGSTDSPPYIDVSGPVTNGTVTLKRLGSNPKQLKFDSLTIPGGQFARFDFRDRTAALHLQGSGTATGVDVIGRLKVTESDWWDEGEVGLREATTEQVRVEGNGTDFAVYWHHAFA